MKRKDNNKFFLEELKMLPSEQLHQTLRAELDRSHKDEALILQISDILEQRDIACQEEDPAVTAAWIQFQAASDAEPRVHNRRKWTARIAVAAAIVCLVILVFPRAEGAPSLLETIGQWTQEIFGFFGGKQQEEPYTFATDDPDLQKVYDLVAKQGVTQPVVPTWLPEGFALWELNEYPTPLGSKIHARFVNGEEYIILSLTFYDEEECNSYAKTDADVDIYEIENQEFYFVENTDMWTVAWDAGNLECSVMTNLGREELRQIIMSIYRR